MSSSAILPTPPAAGMPVPATTASGKATLVPAEIPLSEPVISGNEWKYVKECLDSGWVSSVGSYVDRFEQEFARLSGRQFAVAMASGTAALHVALRAAGVRAGDEVLMPALTFIAPANAVRYCNAHPVFFDSEPHFWQMDVTQVAGYLQRWCLVRDGILYNRLNGRRVAALLPVHILGHPVNLDPLVDLAQQYNLPIVEDATESLGATYHGKAVGGFGLIGCFSFNGNKLLTTGGGGMLVTDDERIARVSRYLSTQAKDDALEYIHHTVGYNYRLTNVQAAIGCAQLERLAEFVAIRRGIAGRYRAGLTGLPCVPLGQAPGVESAFWLSSIRLIGRSSRELIEHLKGSRIQARPLWQPLHLSPAHVLDQPRWALPVADALYRDAISLPSSALLSPGLQDQVIAKVREFLAA